ncbi:MAG: damage-control phosphatase ARMT1 family protein [Cyanophyceae cyanobacterium]
MDTGDHVTNQHPSLPLPPPLLVSEADSFARYTFTQRLPSIAKRVVAENNYPPAVVENIENLTQDLLAGPVRLLKDDGGPDIASWERYLEPFLNHSWNETPFYLAEAYFYRRLLEATRYFQSEPGQRVDPFARQKSQSLQSAIDFIRALSKRANLAQRTPNQTDLIRLLYLSLWGNRVDLSLWPAGEEARRLMKSNQKNILVDDTALLVELISEGMWIDFIIDNAGYELVCDLSLIDFLLTAGVAQVVHLHLKPHPLFVSDATIEDVYRTLEVLAADSEKSVQSLAQRLQGQLSSGRLCLHDNFFWTSPLAFWEMPDLLRQELAEAALVFIKGDANYRRLLGDRHWPLTTAVAEIAGYFPAPLAALRTLKSEVAAGLQPAQVESLNRKDPEWLTNGQWGVIQVVKPSSPSGGRS